MAVTFRGKCSRLVGAHTTGGEMPEDASQSSEPRHRLTRLGSAMTDALEAQPEWRESDKCIVFMQDGDRGGITIHGYDDDVNAAMVDLLAHLQAIFESQGKKLMFAPLGEG